MSRKEDGLLCPSCGEVATFLKEYDEGKHPLSPDDEAALEASREDLMRRVREITAKRHNNEAQRACGPEDVS